MTLNHICKKYNIDLDKPSPFEIPCGKWEGLPGLFRDLGFMTGAEIGVLKGQWSELMCKTIPGLKMSCVDNWTCWEDQQSYWNQDRLNEYEKITREKLGKYDCEIIKMWSMDAVRFCPDESLDFVFIDGNHSFQFVTNDIAEWSRKVRIGGIVAGHDYISLRGDNGLVIHVKDVVRSWTYLYKIHPWFIMRDDRNVSRGISWMWVKE